MREREGERGGERGDERDRERNRQTSRQRGGLVLDTSLRCEDVPNCIANDFRHVNRTEPTDAKKKLNKMK